MESLCRLHPSLPRPCGPATWVTCGNWLLSLALEWLTLGLREIYKVRAPTGPLGASTSHPRVAVPPPLSPALLSPVGQYPRALPGLPAQDSQSCPVQPSAPAPAPAPARILEALPSWAPHAHTGLASFLLCQGSHLRRGASIHPGSQAPNWGVSLCFTPPSALSAKSCPALCSFAATSSQPLPSQRHVPHLPPRRYLP